MNEAIETIKHAAVKSADGWIFIGKHHADCFHKMHHIAVKSSQKSEDQGFITSLGRYVDRHEGARIAQAAKQVEPMKVEILFSENLWSPTDGGKHVYSETEGYKIIPVISGSAFSAMNGAGFR